MRQLFATIREESKYRSQQPKDKDGNKIPFPVCLDLINNTFSPVVGGPGGYYRFYDVDLWVNTGEKLERLAIHSLPDASITLERIEANVVRQ